MPDLLPYEIKALSEHTVRRIVRETVIETLGSLGLDTSRPAELQADLYYLRRLRHGGEDIRRVMRNAGLTLLITTALCLLWEAVKGRLG